MSPEVEVELDETLLLLEGGNEIELLSDDDRPVHLLELEKQDYLELAEELGVELLRVLDQERLVLEVERGKSLLQPSQVGL